MIFATLCCALFLTTDLLWMRIPWWSVAIGLALGGVAHVAGQPLYYGSGLVAGFLCLLAGMPGGDVKAAAVLGLFLPLAQMAMALAIAFALTLVVMRRWPLRVRPWMVDLTIGYGTTILLFH